MSVSVRLALLAALYAQGVAGQSLYVDLSGDWRISLSDRPEYARSDFDDRGWNHIRLPWTDSPSFPEHYWLRRTIEIASGANPHTKALTLGLPGEAYEVYVNGNRVANVGSPEDPWSIQTARPRTFTFHDTSIRVTVALRVWEGWWKQTLPGGVRWLVPPRPDLWPYALTSLENAPRDVSWQAWQNRVYTASPQFPEMAAEALLALLLALLFLSSRESRALLALAALLGALALLRGMNYAALLLDAPMAIGGFPQAVSALGSVALAVFINEVSSVRLRWLRYTAVSAAAVVLLLRLAQCLLVAARHYDAAGWLYSMSAEAHLVMALAAGCLTLVSLRQVSRLQGWANSTVLLHLIGLLLILVDSQRSRGFNFIPIYWRARGMVGDSYDLGVILLSVSAAAIIVRRLGADRREKQRLAGELEAARLVQQLLVAPRDAGPAFAVDTAYQPAQEVGGDFYQVIPFDDGGLLVLVGDVSGKGLKAAMVVSLVVGALANRRSSQPSEILSELNHALAGRLDGGFVTCCCVRFAVGGPAYAANAGHPSPYVDGQEWALPSSLPLGLTPDATYEDAGHLGLSFTLVSDGVVEAASPQHELFGFDRTRDISTRSAYEIATAARAWGQNDDITVVTVRRQA